MKKFDNVEAWVLRVALENFKKQWLTESKVPDDGRRPLFTANYIEGVVGGVKNKVNEFTSAKALKIRAAELKDEKDAS